MVKKSTEKKEKDNITEKSGGQKKEHAQSKVNHSDTEHNGCREELENLRKELQQKIDESQDKYLRLSAEFDNYRKRTLREKADLLKSASEEVIVRVIPVIDDFERALGFMDTTGDQDALKTGVKLIFSKFKDVLNQQGLKEIEAMHQDFDTDRHEAVTKIAVEDPALKGKIVEVLEKGYYLNDKVVRFSKVVIGE